MSAPPPPGPSGGSYPRSGYPQTGYPQTGYPQTGYPQEQGHPPQGAYQPGPYAVGPPTPGYPPAAGPYGSYPPYGSSSAPPPAARQGGTNGFAIASLVLGIIGGTVLSLIFGFVALSQIRRRGETGRGLAIAGIVLSVVWLLAIAALVVVAILTSATRNQAGEITTGGSVSATALAVGDCVNDIQESATIASLPAVPCAESHEGEVFAVFDLPPGPYPGPEAIDGLVQSECNNELDVYAPATIGDAGVGLYFVYPLAGNWAVDDREVVCIATSQSGSTTGSIRDR